MKINKGKILDNKYIKVVSFSKAVLWKDKQLSLPPSEIGRIRDAGIKELIFKDFKKGEDWVFNFDDIMRLKEFKSEGQEHQYYFPISLAKKIKHPQNETNHPAKTTRSKHDLQVHEQRGFC